jgi:hypothetical protein
MRPRCATEDMTYNRRHKIMGRAKEHLCGLEFIGCRGNAEEWALDWRNVRPANLRRIENGPWFSIGLDDDYVAACRPCHRKMDRTRRVVAA